MATTSHSVDSERQGRLWRRNFFLGMMIIFSSVFVWSVSSLTDDMGGWSFWAILGAPSSLFAAILFLALFKQVLWEAWQTGPNFWQLREWQALDQQRFFVVWSKVVTVILIAYVSICLLVLSFLESGQSFLFVRRLERFNLEVFGIFPTNFLTAGAILFVLVIFCVILHVTEQDVEKEIRKIEEKHRNKK